MDGLHVDQINDIITENFTSLIEHWLGTLEGNRFRFRCVPGFGALSRIGRLAATEIFRQSVSTLRVI